MPGDTDSRNVLLHVQSFLPTNYELIIFILHLSLVIKIKFFFFSVKRWLLFRARFPLLNNINLDRIPLQFCKFILFSKIYVILTSFHFPCRILLGIGVITRLITTFNISVYLF